MEYTNFMIAVFFMVLSNVIISISRTVKNKGIGSALKIAAYVMLLMVFIFVFRAFFT